MYKALVTDEKAVVAKRLDLTTPEIEDRGFKPQLLPLGFPTHMYNFTLDINQEFYGEGENRGETSTAYEFNKFSIGTARV